NLKDEREVEYVGGRIAAVGDGSAFPDAALAMAEAFQDPDVQIDISKMDVGVPVGIGAGDSDFVNSNPATTFAWQNLDKGV
ncbi:hypothetical protein SB658_26790, partial [Bacillus sp. SIMBA_008]|uniref:hypothetical protein n=1 Tax=Bacillus sp. SIMBA_008 TaxID=3085757 RepID=UPI00397ACB46